MRADFDDSQEIGLVFEHLELDLHLALLAVEDLLHQVYECCLAFADCWR